LVSEDSVVVGVLGEDEAVDGLSVDGVSVVVDGAADEVVGEIVVVVTDDEPVDVVVDDVVGAEVPPPLMPTVRLAIKPSLSVLPTNDVVAMDVSPAWVWIES
jgi:hypothetical protein